MVGGGAEVILGELGERGGWQALLTKGANEVLKSTLRLSGVKKGGPVMRVDGKVTDERLRKSP